MNLKSRNCRKICQRQRLKRRRSNLKLLLYRRMILIRDLIHLETFQHRRRKKRRSQSRIRRQPWLWERARRWAPLVPWPQWVPCRATAPLAQIRALEWNPRLCHQILFQGRATNLPQTTRLPLTPSPTPSRVPRTILFKQATNLQKQTHLQWLEIAMNRLMTPFLRQRKKRFSRTTLLLQFLQLLPWKTLQTTLLPPFPLRLRHKMKKPTLLPQWRRNISKTHLRLWLQLPRKKMPCKST